MAQPILSPQRKADGLGPQRRCSAQRTVHRGSNLGWCLGVPELYIDLYRDYGGIVAYILVVPNPMYLYFKLSAFWTKLYHTILEARVF